MWKLWYILLQRCSFYRTPVPVARAEERAVAAHWSHGASDRALDEQRAQEAPDSAHEVLNAHDMLKSGVIVLKSAHCYTISR